MKTVLAPLDFSEVTSRVIESTLDLAKELQARVCLLHVIPPPILMSGYGVSTDHLPEHLIREEKKARQRLSVHRKRMEAAGLEVKALTVQGPPIESILLVAREQGADLVVIGSHGHGAFYEFIVGSTTRGVLREFPGLVLIVPCRGAQERERAAS